jgi:hypothetical protein
MIKRPGIFAIVIRVRDCCWGIMIMTMPILGKGIVSAYFLEPTYRLNRNIFFSFRGAAGLAWLTNPYDSQHNSENMSYSTVVNMYTTVGLGLWWRLNEKWRINTSVKLPAHFKWGNETTQ